MSWSEITVSDFCIIYEFCSKVDKSISDVREKKKQWEGRQIGMNIVQERGRTIGKSMNQSTKEKKERKKKETRDGGGGGERVVVEMEERTREGIKEKRGWERERTKQEGNKEEGKARVGRDRKRWKRMTWLHVRN